MFTVIVTLFLVGRIAVLGKHNWTHDEGSYIAAAWMVIDGHKLYSQTVTSSPPLFVDSLAVFMLMLGHSVVAPRLAIVVYSTIGFVSVGLIAEYLKGWCAGILAPLMLFAIPEIFGMSGRCFSALPASCLVSVAILAELKYIRAGKWVWLVLAGVMTAGGVLIKLVALLAIPLPFVSIVVRHLTADARSRPQLRKIVLDNLVVYGAMLLPVIA